MEEPERIDACQNRIGYHFNDPTLLALALTHASDKAGRIEHEREDDESVDVIEGHAAGMLDNERLEFLGDSVLGMVVCEELFRIYPDATEGELTNIKSVAVSRPTLARISDSLGVPECMALGKGMSSYERLPESLRANVYEAVVAAIYLDGGLEAARSFILPGMRPHIELIEKNEHRRNWKSILQQHAQREFGITPTYRVIGEEGPDHIKEFEVVALIGAKEYGHGRGKSKKNAEQEAAGNTLKLLRSRHEPAAQAEQREETEEDA